MKKTSLPYRWCIWVVELLEIERWMGVGVVMFRIYGASLSQNEKVLKICLVTMHISLTQLNGPLKQS